MTEHETVAIKLTPCQRQQLRTALTIAFESKVSIDPGCSPEEWLGVMDAVFRDQERDNEVDPRFTVFPSKHADGEWYWRSTSDGATRSQGPFPAYRAAYDAARQAFERSDGETDVPESDGSGYAHDG